MRKKIMRKKILLTTGTMYTDNIATGEIVAHPVKAPHKFKSSYEFYRYLNKRVNIEGHVLFSATIENVRFVTLKYTLEDLLRVSEIDG